MRSSLLNKSAVSWIFLTLGLMAPWLAEKVVSEQTVTLRVEAEIQDGKNFEVYINENYELFRRAITKNERKVYEFTGLPNQVRILRLDPTDHPNTLTRIHKIELVGHDRKVEIPIHRLTQWQTHECTAFIDKDGAVGIKGPTNDPFLRDPSINLDFHPLIPGINNFILIAVVFSGLAFVGLGGGLSRGFIAPLLLIMSLYYTLGALVCSYCLRRPGPLPTISHAVSKAGFLGFSKTQEFRVYVWVLALFSLAGLALAFLVKGRQWHSTLFQEQEKRNRKKADWKFLGSLLVTGTLLSFRPFDDFPESLEKFRHYLDFDSINFLTWDYMIHRGWLPFKDFWFPYGGLAGQLAPFPWYLFRAYGHQVLVQSVFLCAIYVLLDRRKVWTLIFYGVLILENQSGLIFGFNRYFLGLDLALSLLAIRRIHSNSAWSNWLWVSWGLLIGYTITFEPVQISYATPAIALQIILDVAGTRKLDLEKGSLLRGIFISFLITLAITVGYIAILVSRDQFQGFLEFYKNLPSTATHSYWPLGMQGWFSPRLDLDSIVLMLIVSLSGYGTYLSIVEARAKKLIMSDIVLSAAVFAGMLFLKQIVRPHMARSIVGSLIFGSLFVAYFWSFSWNLRQKRGALLFLGALVAYHYNIGSIEKTLREGANNLAGISKSLQILLRDNDELEKQADRYFSPSNLICGNESCVDLKKFLAEEKQKNPRTTAYMLGDEAYVYILLDQKPPYFLNFYDGSDVKDQRLIANWIEETRPTYVIWNQTYRDNDQVPNPVRVPIIYSKVIEDYKHHTTIGNYEVLKRQPDKSKIDLNYWRTTLGENYFLGYLGIPSTAPSLKDCPSVSSLHCEEFIEVQTEASTASPEQRIQIQVGDQAFALTFMTRSGQSQYTFNLDKIWFWKVGKSLGLALTIVPNPSTQIKRFSKLVPPEILY